jgi:hypothetical protein
VLSWQFSTGSSMLIDAYDTSGLMFFELLQGCVELAHAVSTRSGLPGLVADLDLAWIPGDDPAAARSRIASAAAALGVDPPGVCCALQVHGSSVACIDELPPFDANAPCRVCGEYDALVTDRPGITLLVRVADCVPVLLYDPERRVVAAVHAGWKGTLADIAAATVERMSARYGCRPSSLLAGIGPSIGPCCFEVGDDVAGKFRDAPGRSGSVLADRGGFRIDLPCANRASLLRCGVLPHNIDMSGYCTACRRDIFFSHRGEKGNAGRFGLFAGLRA